MGDTVFHDYDNVHGIENDYQDYAEDYLQTALDINKIVADNINISGNSGALYTSVRGEKLYQVMQYQQTILEAIFTMKL